MIDYNRLKKPPQLADDIWQQHLQWMEVVGRQAEENLKKMLKQTGDQSGSGINPPGITNEQTKNT